ncbi:MAG: hypothetical protein AAGI24_15025 [Pseudomonadota bacterium]
MKAHFLLCLSILFGLSSCKIILNVPESGTISTESGSISCDAGRICEIDVDDADFEEVFVATPSAGFEFRGWRRRAGGLCQGSEERLSPCLVSTAIAEGEPALLDVLLLDFPVFLEPEFAPAPRSTLIFPSASSISKKPETTIRGESYDMDGISTVLVNGRTATLTIDSDAAESSSTPRASTWEVELPLAAGSNDVSVSIVDTLGNVSEQTGLAEIEYTPIPLLYAFDPTTNQLVGVGQERSTGWEFVSTDLVTGESQINTSQFPLRPQAYCYKPDTREYLYVEIPQSDQALVSIYDVDSGLHRDVSTLTLNATDSFNISQPFGLSLSCGADNGNAYLTYSIINLNVPSTTSTYIIRLSIETGAAEELVSFEPKGDERLRIGTVELMGEDLIARRTGPSDNDRVLLRINTVSGEITELEESRGQFVLSMATDSSAGIIYTVDFSGIYKFQPGLTGLSLVSINGVPGVEDFGNLGRMTVDTARNRLLIWDGDSESYLGVDLDSGRRSEVFSVRRGEGDKIANPKLIAMSSDKKTLYVIDGGNPTLPSRLIAVEYSTGNRRLIADFSILRLSDLSNSLEIDDDKQLAYIGFPTRIVAVSLQNGQQSVVADSDIGFGSTFGASAGVVLDEQSNRLLYADSEQQSIVQIELATLRRTVLSRAEEKGEGQPFTALQSLELDNDSSRVFAADQGLGAVFSVNLTTGDRTRLTATCRDERGLGLLGPSWALGRIIYTGDTLILFTRDISEVDVDSGDCRGDRSYHPDGIKPIELIPVGQDTLLFGIFGGEVGLLDRRTGASVVISL